MKTPPGKLTVNVSVSVAVPLPQGSFALFCCADGDGEDASGSRRAGD